MAKEKSLYETLCKAQEFFRNVKREMKTGYPYVSWEYNIKRRERKAGKKEPKLSILAKVGVGVVVIAILPVIALVSQYKNPSKVPQLRLSPKPNAMVWSYPGEYQTRNFMDERPYGSLDEVILRTKEGKNIILHRGDDGFVEQEKDYLKIVVSYQTRSGYFIHSK